MSITPNRRPTKAAIAIWRAAGELTDQAACRQGSDLLRIPRAVQADLDNLAGHDLANRIVAIHQMKPAEGQVERLL
jgi:hypothetical protein